MWLLINLLKHDYKQRLCNHYLASAIIANALSHYIALYCGVGEAKAS